MTREMAISRKRQMTTTKTTSVALHHHLQVKTQTVKRTKSTHLTCLQSLVHSISIFTQTARFFSDGFKKLILGFPHENLLRAGETGG